MFRSTPGVILALACAVCFTATTAAQELLPSSPPPVGELLDRGGLGFRPGPPSDARRGAPVDAMETLTGVRSPEAGRERDEIETDRDSFTPATTTAGRRRLVIESAYTFLDNRGIKETHSFPELVLRYGVTDRIELRLGWNYEVGGAVFEESDAEAGEGHLNSRNRLIREHSIQYGVKVQLTEQSGWLPRAAAILQGVTPTGGSVGAPTATQLIATGVVGWEFHNRWRFDTAMRYGTASESGDRFNNWAPSAVLRVPVGERWAVHGEYFGVYTSGKSVNDSRCYFSPGVHCLVTPDLEVGVRLGWGLNDQAARFFANVGFGWRY